MAAVTVGEGSEIPWEFVFQWKIKDFFSLSNKEDEFFNSPPFYFGSASWYLRIYPNGQAAANLSDGQVIKTTGYVGLYLFRDSPGSPLNMNFSFGFKRVDEKIDFEWKSSYVFTTIEGWGKPRFLHRLALLTNKSELITSGDLTVICKIKYPKPSNAKSDTEQAAVCCHCKVTFDADKVSPHQRQCMHRPIKCQGCFGDVLLQNMLDGHKCQNEGKGVLKWIKENCKEASTQTQDENKDRSFCQDIKKMLLHGRHHDIILKVGDRELQAHRDILRTRSHVIESMFDLDMKEKNSDFINIEDCDADTMELFLSYIYSGTVDNLDQSSMLNLYYIADKYDMKGLKDVCSDFIQQSLALTNICKVIQLAMNHTDLCLLENATEYFMDNVLEIMITVEWQSFLKENTTVGNELLMKAFKKLKNT